MVPTVPSTPDSLLDVGEKAGTIPTFILTTFDESSAKRNRSSGTGLDGPLSSGSDKILKMLRDGLSDVRESTRSAELSTNSQRLNSNTSGSIDWERNWKKRKPRRKHNVSEAANQDLSPLARPVYLSVPGSDKTTNSGSSISDDESDGKSCSYLSQHGVHSHAMKRYGTNSCPELHRQYDELENSFGMLKTRDSWRPASQVHSDTAKDRNRRHFHVRNVVTKQFWSIGHRLRRSGSTFSIRSEFPAPPDSKERRLLARDSVDIWPSSGDETPMYNTPESNVSPLPTVRTHLDPLAMASMMIVTAELDRLTSRSGIDRSSKASGSSTGFSPASPTPLYSGSASPSNGASLSNSSTLEVPPNVPFNTPASSSSQSVVASPSSRSPQRRGQRRRGQRSHLSEVTTPDEVASPLELGDDFGEGHLTLSPPQFESLPECSTAHPGGNEGDMYSRPLAISRAGYEQSEPHKDTPSIARRTSSIPSVSITPSESPPPSDKPTSLLRSLSGLSDNDAILPPNRVSSIRKTPESMYGPKVTDNTRNRSMPGRLRGLGHCVASLAIVPDVGRPKVLHINKPASAPVHTSNNVALNPRAQVFAKETTHHSEEHLGSHGELGNSDPFSQSGYLKTRRHSGHDSYLQPSGSMSEDSIETVYTVVVSKGAKSKSKSDNAVREGKYKKSGFSWL